MPVTVSLRNSNLLTGDNEEMEMSTQIIVSIGLAVMGIVLSIIGYFLKKALSDNSGRFDKLEHTVIEKFEGLDTKVDTLDAKFVSMREEMLKDYVRKEDFAGNAESHKELWKELNETKTRVAIVESRQKGE